MKIEYLKHRIPSEATQGSKLQDDGSCTRCTGVRFCACSRLRTPDTMFQVHLSSRGEKNITQSVFRATFSLQETANEN